MKDKNFFWAVILLLLSASGLTSCNSTKYVPEGKYLLRKNSFKIKSQTGVLRKGELKDQLEVITSQKTNTYWSGVFPFKLWFYNWKHDKYERDSTQPLPKSVERPVLYDSAQRSKSALYMKNFMFNQGYFNAIIKDTVVFRRKKAYVTYSINTGINYSINNINLDIDDSLIRLVVKNGLSQTYFKRGTEYSKVIADEERSRIATQLHNFGYYRLSQENIAFELDTVNKSEFRNSENLFESAINFLALQKQQKNYSLDVKVTIRSGGDSLAYYRYQIGRMQVFPDFVSGRDFRDTTMVQKSVGGVTYKYHNYYVRENTLHRHIFISPDDYYSQSNFELTVNKLNELGIFQYVRVDFREDTSGAHRKLNCYIFLSPSKKLDAAFNTEIANATTYIIGGASGISYRDKNLFHGGNQFTIAATGGLEFGYNELRGETVSDHFYLQSTNIGLNAALNIPNFLLPFRQKRFKNSNLPRTIINVGVNVLDRISYFKMSNTTANFAYNWKESATKTWELSPAFASVVIPTITDSFQRKLDSNEFLKNSYRRTFIEGEAISFTFSDQFKRNGRNYNYLRIGLEEAGLLMWGVEGIGQSLNPKYKFLYDEYVKLDIDARKYFNRRHSSVAMRFIGGFGLPYGTSTTLPYVKQYFVGGPYSIRGWRPRTLGPVSISDTSNQYIDRTGDIKLEANIEYRFDMIQLFSGTINLNGAIFADAGNTWLARSSDRYPNGEFNISRLGQDIAISTGAGLRMIIASFFTVRLDAAFPIKNPYIQKNNGWVLREVDLGNSNWRTNNLVLNVAIGMPF